MGYILCGLSNNLSVQTSDSNRFFDHWSLIHRNVSIIVWCSPHHVPYPGNQRERFSSHLHEAMCLLQGLWGKFRSFRTRSAPKAAPTHQTYQHVLSSFLQAHVKWINQNLSNWHWISDDVLTKALPQSDFQRHRHHICGQWVCWSYHCDGVCDF